jgi:flagellar export protein FliJ
MYRFRLQRVLDYRRRQAESLARDLSLSQQQVRHAAALLEALRVERQAHQERFEATQGKALRSEELKMWQLMYDDIGQRIVRQEADLERLQERLTTQQQAVIQARQEEKTLEKVREKQERRYALEVTRHAQRLLDEGASMRSYYEHTADADGNSQS